MNTLLLIGSWVLLALASYAAFGLTTAFIVRTMRHSSRDTNSVNITGTLKDRALNRYHLFLILELLVIVAIFWILWKADPRGMAELFGLIKEGAFHILRHIEWLLRTKLGH